MMLWYKVCHIIFVVTWFAGLFYLPRLFVYTAESSNADVHAVLRIMQKKLYYYIMVPSAILATVSGLMLYMSMATYYAKAGWMHIKLLLVVILWLYHLSCGHYRRVLLGSKSWPSGKFFRFYNEIPSVILIVTVMLVILKPSFA